MGPNVNQCLATPPKLRSCVRKQITNPKERARFDQKSACINDFTEYVGHRRRVHLIDRCQYADLKWQPLISLPPEGRKQFLDVSKKIEQLMNTSGYTKGSRKWIKLASIALFWTMMGKDESKDAKKTYQQHVAKYPPLSKWIDTLTEPPLALDYEDKVGGIFGSAYLSSQYIRLWREFMRYTKIPESKARIQMMVFPQWNAPLLTFNKGLTFCRVSFPHSRKHLDLDPTFFSTKFKGAIANARPASESCSWIVNLFSRNNSTKSRRGRVHKYLIPHLEEFKGCPYFSRVMHKVLSDLGLGAASKEKFKQSNNYFLKARDLVPKDKIVHASFMNLWIATGHFYKGEIDKALKYVNLIHIEKLSKQKIQPAGDDSNMTMHLNIKGIKKMKALILFAAKKYKQADAIMNEKDVDVSSAFNMLQGIIKGFKQKSAIHKKPLWTIMDFVFRYFPKSVSKAPWIQQLIDRGDYGEARQMIKLARAIAITKGSVSDSESLDYLDAITKQMEKAKIKRPKSIVDHTFSVSLLGTDNIEGSILAGYELAFPIRFSTPLAGMAFFAKTEVGMNNDIDAEIRMRAGARLYGTMRLRHRLGIELSGGGMARLSDKTQVIEPFGWFSMFYRARFGPTFDQTDHSSAIAHGLAIELGVRFDKDWRDSFLTLSYELSF